MKVRTLSNTEEQLYGAGIAVSIEAADAFAGGAATSGTATLLNAPAGTAVRCVGTRLVTPFASTGTANLTVQVGVSGTAAQHLAAQQVGAAHGSLVTHKAGVFTPTAYDAATDIIATFTSSGVNLNTFTTVGELVVFLQLIPLTKIAAE